MIYHDGQQWQICPHIAHFMAHGEQDFKYTHDRQWWERFVMRWWHHHSLTFTNVVPTQGQIDRLALVNAAGIPDTHQHAAAMYVECGLLVDPEDPLWNGFVEDPDFSGAHLVVFDRLTVDRWSIPADGATAAVVTYTSPDPVVYFSVDGEVHEVATQMQVATLEVTADAPGPVEIKIKDHQAVIITATEAV